jgi:hypothetical protein
LALLDADAARELASGRAPPPNAAADIAENALALVD